MDQGFHGHLGAILFSPWDGTNETHRQVLNALWSLFTSHGADIEHKEPAYGHTVLLQAARSASDGSSVLGSITIGAWCRLLGARLQRERSTISNAESKQKPAISAFYLSQ